MIDTVWFEDELEPSLDTEVTQVKGNQGQQVVPQYPQQQARGVVRVSMPLWKPLGPAPLGQGSPTLLWLVRLRFQFVAESGSRFVFARCQAYLEPGRSGEPIPMVYDFYPQDMSKGEPSTVAIELGPHFNIAGIIDLSAGKMNTEITVGRVQPTVIGFPGQDDRAPFWDLRATGDPIEGTHTFWLILAQPAGCSEIRLYTRASGTIESSRWSVPVRPKQQAWDSRPYIVIR
jgi:hypothetical protein